MAPFVASWFGMRRAGTAVARKPRKSSTMTGGRTNSKAAAPVRRSSGSAATTGTRFGRGVAACSPMSHDDVLLQSLQAAVGASHVLTDADLRASYETDWTRRWR